MVFPSGACQTVKVLAAAGAFVRAAVLKNYGGKSENPRVCPGEDSCDRFQSAKGKTRAAKERNACKGCELFDTKRDRFRESQKGLSELVSAAEYVQRRRDSGYPMPVHQVTDLMLETLLMLDECRDQEERILRLQTKSALIAGFGLKVAA